MIFKNNHAWLKNRFQTMGTAEVISRLADVGRHLALCASVESRRRRPPTKAKTLNQPYKLPRIEYQLDRTTAQTQHAVIVAATPEE
jgi:hypothetical protein